MGRSVECLCHLVLGVVLLIGLNPSSALIRMKDPLGSTFKDSVRVEFLNDERSLSDHNRVKRDVRSDLPFTLNFKVGMSDGDEKHLRLEQHERSDDIVPAYLIRDGRLERLDIDHGSNWALYTDEDETAVFLVHRHNPNDPKDVTLNGAFHHKGRRMQLRPDYDHPDANNRKKRSADADAASFFSGETYTLSDERLDFGHDSIVPKEKMTYNFDTSRYSRGDGSAVVRRRKRDASSQTSNVVEMCVSIDAAEYQKFLENANNDASQAVKDIIAFYSYLETIVNLMYATYNSASSSQCVQIRVVGLVIATNDADTPWFNDNVLNNGNVDGDPSLDDWGVQGPQLFSAADQYTAFTGKDIEADGSDGVLGIAFLGGMCSSSNSALVSENLESLSTATVWAHELGHNLNAQHDTESGLGCTDNDKFIMAASISFVFDAAKASNPWTFSSCSRQQFDTFLASSTTNCLRTTSCPSSVLATDQLPGQAMDADEQCKMNLDSDNGEFCRVVYGDNNLDIADTMCYRLFCKQAGSSVCSGFFAFDYTSCGNRKWCIRGQCVSNDLAPPRFTDCPAGDVPSTSCSSSSCNNTNTARACCETCAIDAGTTLEPFSTPATQAVTTAAPNHLCHDAVTSVTSPTSPTTQDVSETTQDASETSPDGTETSPTAQTQEVSETSPTAATQGVSPTSPTAATQMATTTPTTVTTVTTATTETTTTTQVTDEGVSPDGTFINSFQYVVKGGCPPMPSSH